MSNYIKIFILILFSMLLCSCSTGNSGDTDNQSPPAKQGSYVKYLDCLNYDAMLFEKSIGEADAYAIKDLSAGVVPHHLLAGDLIASFFLTARDLGKDYETVIIIGPNHKGEGAAVSIADSGWRTPYGTLDCDSDIVSQVLSEKSLVTAIDNELLEKDQADSSIIPYVGYYLPNVKVVTILLSRNVSQENYLELSDLISRAAAEKKILLVGSIDFSHGLSVQEAGQKDELTEQTILDYNLDLIKTMGNDYLDSPETLCCLLSYMKLSGAEQVVILSHGSAADYLTDPAPCTSYFVLGSSGK